MDALKEWPAVLQFEHGAAITEEVVSQRYRELAKKYHPDAGGTVDDMQQLNLAKKLALEWVSGERKRQEDLQRAKVIVAQHIAAAQNAMNSAYSAQFAQQQAFMNQFSSAMNYAGTTAEQCAQSAQYPLRQAPAEAQQRTEVEQVEQERKRRFWGNFFRSGKAE